MISHTFLPFFLHAAISHASHSFSFRWSLHWYEHAAHTLTCFICNRLAPAHTCARDNQGYPGMGNKNVGWLHNRQMQGLSEVHCTVRKNQKKKFYGSCFKACKPYCLWALLPDGMHRTRHPSLYETPWTEKLTCPKRVAGKVCCSSWPAWAFHCVFSRSRNDGWTRGFREKSLHRKEIFITTKAPGDDGVGCPSAHIAFLWFFLCFYISHYISHFIRPMYFFTSMPLF